MDALIYPRLKLKSEVFSKVLDGRRTDFVIMNDRKQMRELEQYLHPTFDSEQNKREDRILNKVLSEEQKKL